MYVCAFLVRTQSCCVDEFPLSRLWRSDGSGMFGNPSQIHNPDCPASTDWE